MAKTEPIRNIKKVKAIQNMLKGQEKWRDYAMFTLGINFGLRIQDLLSLRVKHVIDIEGNVRSHFKIKEQKTGKDNIIKINKRSKEVVKELINETGIGKLRNNYLFYNTRKKRGEDNISRVQAYTLINRWCEKVGITEKTIGTHTLRKTHGYLAWKQGNPIESIQEKFKHSTPATTRRYIGVNQKNVDDVYDSVSI